jgi:calcium-dependent protein kinase
MAYPNKAKFDTSTPKKILNFNQVFTISKIVGQGGFGKVYKILDKQSNKPYALKMQKIFDRNTLKEIEMLKILSKDKTLSQDVVKYYDHFMFNNQLCILMEFIDGQEADDFFQTHKFGTQDFIVFAIWLTNIINKLHKLNYIHRDIKPGNILVTKTGYKLIDFGFSCRLGRLNDPLRCPKDEVGTPVFIAPELLKGYLRQNDKYFKTIDVYAVGVTLYYILSRSFPYKLNHQGFVIGTKYHYVYTKIYGKQINDLLYGMTNLNPNQRLTIDQSYKRWLKLQ